VGDPVPSQCTQLDLGGLIVLNEEDSSASWNVVAERDGESLRCPKSAVRSSSKSSLDRPASSPALPGSVTFLACFLSQFRDMMFKKILLREHLIFHLCAAQSKDISEKRCAELNRARETVQ
jgi:hypothetical protein